MHEDLVVRKRWISERRFLHALNFCMLLPGPEAQQLATYLGWLMHRTWGGVIAGTLFVLPSLLILIGLSWLYMAHRETPVVAGLLWGIKPAVTAIVVSAAHRIGTRTLRGAALWGIAIAAFASSVAWATPFPLIVLCAAAIGFVGGRLSPGSFGVGDGHAESAQTAAPAVIDDHSPPPAHTAFSWRRGLRVALACLATWLSAMGTLIALFGWDGLLTQMAWFFTKAALMTFGGAYAVLPYVHQGAVEHFQWLSSAQMMDGLALGETTPGPLIMVVSFVGFVGGWGQALFGPDALIQSGSVAALVVTLFTFLPSFFFILVGGPFIESTHGKAHFTAPLTGLSAAVIGVILSLAAAFAQHVLWPTELQGGLDWPAALIGLGAAWALMRHQASVLAVVAASALSGLAWRLAQGL